MLCDDLLAHGLPAAFDRKKSGDMVKRIATAGKFRLKEDCVAVATALQKDLRQIAKALPLCRLPYGETWIEHNKGLGADGTLNTRVGFLLTAQDGRFNAFKAHAFYSRGGKPFTVTLSAAALQVDLEHAPEITGIGDIGDQLGRTSVFDDPDYGLPMLRAGVLDAYKEFARTCGETWSGEIPFILAVLALLNARNTTEQNLVDKSEHNRKRARRGQLPLSSHYELTIHPRQAARARADAEEGSSLHEQMRAHWVRGHWKVRKSGIFFWRPFRRGSDGIGTIDKTYVVKNSPTPAIPRPS